MCDIINIRIKELYSNKCQKHNNKCLILDRLNKNISSSKITHLHILDAGFIEDSYFYENLPDSIEFLEIFNLNFDLLNLPIGLKKLFVISYKQKNIKVPFNCIFEERIMNYEPESWYSQLGNNFIRSIELRIGGTLVDKVINMQELENNDSIYAGKLLDIRTKKIYEIANYEI
jgi:hypothetical protein